MKPKSFVLRIYAIHDADLINLYAHGISMATLAKNVLMAYAHNEPLHYTLPELTPIMNFPNRTCRTRFTISDEKTLTLLSQIRDRKINAFVKLLIRNALARQNISVFFEPGAAQFRIEQELNRESAMEPNTTPLKPGYKSITIEEMIDSITPSVKTPTKEEAKEEPGEEGKTDVKQPVEPKRAKKKAAVIRKEPEKETESYETPLYSITANFNDTEPEEIKEDESDQESMNIDMLRMLQQMDTF